MDKKELEKIYKQEGSLRGACKKLKVSYETVRGYLREFQIPRNKQGRPKKFPSRSKKT